LHFKYKSSTKAKRIRREQLPLNAKSLESSDNSEEGYAKSSVTIAQDANSACSKVPYRVDIPVTIRLTHEICCLISYFTASATTMQGLYSDQYHHFLESIRSSNPGGDTGDLSSSKMPASSEISVVPPESQNLLASFHVQSTTQDARTFHFSDSFVRDLEGLYHQPDQQVNKSFSVEPVATSDFCTEGQDDFDISSIFSHQKDPNEDMERPN